MHAHGLAAMRPVGVAAELRGSARTVTKGLVIGIFCYKVRGLTGGTMAIVEPLDLHQEPVRPEWIDYNGHMNVAYYVLAFDHAVDSFYDWLGLDEDYRRRTGGSTFAVESHVTYQRELKLGDPMRFTVQLLGADAKRMHHFYRMYHAQEGFLAATCEWLSLHIDLEQRKVAPFAPDLLKRIEAVVAAHASLPFPDEAGRVIKRLGEGATVRPVAAETVVVGSKRA